MKKLILGCTLAGSLLSMSAFADEWTGFVGDSKCGAMHTGAAPEKDAACAKKCIKGGADPVFVTDGKVLKFDSDSKDKAVAHAGETVKINGTLDGDVVKVESIETASK